MDERGVPGAVWVLAVGRYPEMKIPALAPEQNYAQFYWAIVDVRRQAAEEFGARHF